jgi:predicted DNA-binding transcriptional regulator YafY
VAVELEQVAERFRVAGGSGLELPLTLMADAQRAVRERRVMRILYYTAGRDEERERAIEPHFLANVAGDWMLVAWDRWRDQDRVFMLARVREHAVLEETFRRRPELDPRTYDRHVFRTERGSAGPFEVVLRFDAYQARWIRERTWHPSQELEELPDGGVRLRLRVSGEGDLLRWVLGYGSHVEVEAPPRLRERVAEELRRAVWLYEVPRNAPDGESGD